MNDAQNISFRWKAQSAKGTPATGASGFELPIIASSGFRLDKATISDPAIGSDGMRAKPRHGSRSVSGSVGTVVRLGATDMWLAYMCRQSAWTAAAQVTQATMTSITTTTSTIVAAGGSWLTQGVRVGQVVYLTNHSTAGNNSIPLIVTAVTASTITVVGAGGVTTPLAANAVADTTFELNIAKWVAQGVTKTYLSIDQYFADADISLTAQDVILSSLDVALAPDAAATLTFGLVGIDAASQATGSSPVLTSPTTYETANMVATDATLLKNGVAVTNLTGLSLKMENGAATLPVIGATISPDVFVENTRITGSFAVPMEDATWFEHFNDEDELSILVQLKEPETGLFDHLTMYLPLVVLTKQPDWSLGGTGPLIGTVEFEAGRKNGTPSTSGFAETMIQFSTSAA